MTKKESDPAQQLTNSVTLSTDLDKYENKQRTLLEQMVKAEKNDPIVKKIAQNSQNNSFGDFFLLYVLPVLLWLHPVSYLLSGLIDFEIGFLVSFLTGLWGTYYVYNDVVFEFFKNLYSTKFSLEDFFKLLTVRQRCDTLLRSKKVFQNHFGSIFSRPKWYELSGPQSKLSLANQDPDCLARGGENTRPLD